MATTAPLGSAKELPEPDAPATFSAAAFGDAPASPAAADGSELETSVDDEDGVYGALDDDDRVVDVDVARVEEVEEKVCETIDI